MAKSRRRFKQTSSLKDRLEAWARAMRDEAASMRPGPERDALLQKAGQAESAVRIDAWISAA